MSTELAPLNMSQIGSANVSSPASGSDKLFFNTDGNLAYKDNNGRVWAVQQGRGRLGQRTSNSSAINTTHTVVLQSVAKLFSPYWGTNSTVHFYLGGTCTSSAANTSTFKLLIGTAGTTSDAVAFTWTFTASTTGTNTGFWIEGSFILTSTGASAAGSGLARASSNGVTAGIVVGNGVSTGTAGSFDSTADNFISVSYQASASTTTATFTHGLIEFL